MNTDLTQDQLISIIVITYNSSPYIIETLESIKAQTYKNIELIISDDNSTDSTVPNCATWLEKNKTIFKRTILITSEINTGIAANANRGLKVSEGDWIKLLGGDDKLYAHYCERIVEFVNATNAVLIYSRITPFTDESDNPELLNEVAAEKERLEKNYYLYQSDQLKAIFKSIFVATPSLLLKKELLLKIDGYDERFSNEDVPLYVTLLNKGYRFHFLDEPLVYYRIHFKSASRNPIKNEDGLINITKHKYNKKLFFHLYAPVFIKHFMISRFYSGFVQITINEVIIKLNNKKTYFNTIVYNVLLVFLPRKFFLLLFNKIKKYGPKVYNLARS